MMGGYGMMGEGGWWLGWVFMLLVWLLVLGGVVALAKWIFGTSFGANRGSDRRAIEILRERYARGEIDKAEFDQKRRDLGG